MHSDPYEFSGRSGLAVLLPLIGVAAAAVSAFVYAWINVYCPVGGYVSLLFVALLAAGAVLPVAFAGRWLKIRSLLHLRFTGLATGLAAVYLAWAFFAWVMVRKVDAENAPSALQWIQAPAALWEFANLVAEEGWYTVGSSLTPKGILLWLFWAVEAAIVVGAGWLLAPKWILGRGFCEDCNAWMADEEPLCVFTPKGGLAAAVRKDGLGGIREVEPPSARGRRWLSLARQRCPQCRQAAVYRVDDVQLVETEKGRKQVAAAVVPLSWLREAEAAEFARIEQLLAAADAERMAHIKQQPVADAAEA